ncbi:hypothetical protein MNB_SUP05-SYMBIONT-5-1157 [hydrothermal vent metagenome]|uniref:Cell division protein FtsL n=1 Tax=hydrothermal vent metagenome TaxID=652676 RepID=A0A1W1E1C0_9ZZZZ
MLTLLKKTSILTYINIVLATIVITLSIHTIKWHHQSRLLFKKAEIVNKHSQKIIALEKQLLSKYSEQMSGNTIREKAIKLLNMQPSKKVRNLTL